MKGRIRTLQDCPVCGSKFQLVPRLGFICTAHKTIPNRFYIDLWQNGERYRIFSNKMGEVISSFDQADKLLDRINDEIKKHAFEPSHWIRGEAQKFYVAELINKYREAKTPKLAPSYQKMYRYICNRAADFFPLADVRELRKIDVINYMEHLEKIGLKGKTLKNNMDVFRTFLNWCKEMEIISYVPPFPDIEVIRPETKWITQKDQISLYDMAPEGDKPIIGFLMLHGVRPGEARALKIKDVNLAAQSITISSTWSANVLREKRKGRKAPPVIIGIHPELLGYIEERMRTALPGAFLFVNPRSGNHYTDSALDRVWKGILKKAGIKGLQKKDATRHSYATNLAIQGTPLTVIKNMLGHTSIQTTERYTHADIRTMQVEMKKLSLKKVIPLTVSEPSVEKNSAEKGQ
jgi:integrase